jgi:hypothetical protein
VTNVLAGVNNVQVNRAFVRAAPPAVSDVHTVTLTSGSDLASDLTVEQAKARTVVTNYHKLVTYATHHPSTRAQSLVKAYSEQGRQASVDAAGIGATSGCVFALVVAGPPDQLQRLAASPEVRVLDPAPAAVPVGDLMIVPLEPQVTAQVPALGFAGG